MNLYDILARLKDVKQGSDGNYLACCPAHDDKKQSLAIKDGDKGIVFKCYAGCGTREICAKLGIEMKDLFHEQAPKPSAPRAPRKIVKTYPYTDAEGKLLFEVVRYEPKGFSQRMPDPEHPGKWLWKTSPVQVLYRLPDVVKAINAGEWVCVAEGEKDADTLVRLGYCGTTIAMGAGKWKSQHTEQLNGARVLAFADNDTPGMKHVDDIVVNTKGHVKSCRGIYLNLVWKDMPEKADVTDMAEKFGDEEAKRMIEELIRTSDERAKRIENVQTPEEISTVYDNTETGKLFHEVPGFTVKDGCICTLTTDGGLKQLSTFTAIPRKVITKDDGATVQSGFDVEGWARDGKRLGTAWVTAKEFGRMEWPGENWGFRANIMPGTTNKDKLRYVIAEVGNKTAERVTMYCHTGWRQVDGKLCYLHGGGAIGAEGLQVNLEGKLSAYDMSLGAELTPADGAPAVKRVFEVISPNVSFPLMGMMYLAPLCEFLEKEGNMPKFSLFLLGKTQSGKTTAAQLALCHFGNFKSMESIPASFTDTANSVQRSAFLLKDMPILVDDYFPVGSIQERRKMEMMAQTLSRSFGNGASRGRLNSDMTQRAGLPPRGVAIFTGEDTPDIKESGLARYFMVNVESTDVPKNRELTELQKLAAQGHLVAVMRGYVAWLGRNAEKLPGLLAQRYEEYRYKAQDAIGSGSARAAAAVADLMLGIEMMCRYLGGIGALDADEAQVMQDGAWISFVDTSRKQLNESADTKPTKQFLQIVSELIGSKAVSVPSVDDTRDGINVVGYSDAEYYYFLPETLFKYVCRLCADQGGVFPLSFGALKKQLVEEKKITDEMRGKQKKIRGKNGKYLWIPRWLIDGKDPPGRPTEMVEVQEEIPFND